MSSIVPRRFRVVGATCDDAVVTHHISDEQRRIRLARRHAIHPQHRVHDPVAATHAMTVLHATEAASVHLSVQARVDDVSVDDIERALYDDRSLVKQLAMRRTLFVFPRDLLPAAWGSASARVAATELRRLAQDVEKAGVADDGTAWVDAAVAQVVAHLSDERALDVTALRAALPDLQSRITFGSGKWTQEGPVAPRVVTVAGARGDVVRGENAGHWRVSKPHWTSMARWLGEQVRPLDEAAGYAELVRRWLATFGPGTETDIVWWLGATKSAVRRALTDVGAVAVGLDSGDTGYVLPDDLDADEPVEEWAALLPTLDPTSMGWKQRDFYLDPDDVPYLVDRAGNIGTTAWWNGRVVGCWVQDDDARVTVVVRNPEKLPAAALRALEAQADRLTDWLDGVVVNTVYASPQMKGLAPS